MTLFGLVAISSGCSTTEERLTKAATAKGQIAAGVDIGALPERCRQHISRVYPKAGEKARWTQKGWENSAGVTDDQIDFCAAFDDARRARLANGTPR
jgi:hypothetical protein